MTKDNPQTIQVVEAGRTHDPEHIAELVLRAKRLDLSAMDALNDLMRNADSDRIRLDSAKEWLAHQREMQSLGLKVDEAEKDRTHQKELLVEKRQNQAITQSDQLGFTIPGNAEGLEELRRSFLKRGDVPADVFAEADE